MVKCSSILDGSTLNQGHIFKVGGGGGGGFETTACEKVCPKYFQNLKKLLKSAIYYNIIIIILLHIKFYGYPTIIRVKIIRISSNFNNPMLQLLLKKWVG